MVRSLEEENVRLKRIIAKQAIELECKTEHSKKGMSTFRKEGGNDTFHSKSDSERAV
jgi:hypothetical protein